MNPLEAKARRGAVVLPLLLLALASFGGRGHAGGERPAVAGVLPHPHRGAFRVGHLLRATLMVALFMLTSVTVSLVGVMPSLTPVAAFLGALGAALAVAPAFAPASPEIMAQCHEMLARAAAVVDSGFLLGQANQDNAALLRQALQEGKPVFSLRSPQEGGRLLGRESRGVVYCADETELAARLSEHLHDQA